VIEATGNFMGGAEALRRVLCSSSQRGFPWTALVKRLSARCGAGTVHTITALPVQGNKPG
jgi:hypothetical protein